MQGEGRSARWEAHPDAHVEYVPGELFDELRFGSQARTFARNSILLVPELLTQEERQLLVQAAEHRAHEVGGATNKKLRLSVVDRPHSSGPGEPGGMGSEPERLWESIINERVLPLVTKLPEECSKLFSAECEHATLEYLGLEPTVNRYQVGGAFEPHRDEMTVTVLCLLENNGFEGGGTEFWAEEAHQRSSACTIRLHPHAGTGVLFHGQLWHAGSAVRSGVRYLLVASFCPTGALIRPRESQVCVQLYGGRLKCHKCSSHRKRRCQGYR